MLQSRESLPRAEQHLHLGVHLGDRSRRSLHRRPRPDLRRVVRGGGLAASLTNNQDAAIAAGRSAAENSLRDRGQACADLVVTIDASDFEPGGDLRATVTCVADLSDLAGFGLPGSKTFTSTAGGTRRGTPGAVMTRAYLVDGSPYDPLRAGGYGWLADTPLDQYLTASIVEVAHIVATRARESGDPQMARWASEKAIGAAPSEDKPRLDLAQTLAALGRVDAANRYEESGIESVRRQRPTTWTVTAHN